MYSTLVPCPSCARHVLASETNCPFCSAALPTDLASRAVPPAGRRLNRAAAFVFGASLAVAGCSGEVDGGGTTGGSSSGGNGQDAGTDSGPDDGGGVMPLYGDPPPQDAGPDVTDDGGGSALYGVPPPIDAGDGGGAPLYGAPPPNP